MSLLHDHEIEAAAPGRARDLAPGPAWLDAARRGPEVRTDLAVPAASREVPGSWSVVTGPGRRGGHPGLRGAVTRLQMAAGNAAVAGLLGPRAAEARATRRVAPTLRHAGETDAPGSAPGSAVPLGTDGPAQLDDDTSAPTVPAPTSSFTHVGPPTKSSYTVSGTLRQAAEAVAARPEAGATIVTPDLNIADDGKWPTHTQVTVTQVVELPEWDGKAAATQNQRDEWDRFKAAITAHEAGHVAIDTTSFANAHVKVRAKKTRPLGEAEFETIVTQDVTANDAYDGDAHGRPATNINPNIDEVTKVP